MAKYLDLSGLSTLWGKLTSKFVRYDAAQTLTTAQQEQARKNIAAGNTNPNLLDNSWFQVNSRNWSSTDAGTLSYTVDRWRKGTNGKAEKLTKGIRLSTPSSNELYLTQLIPSDIRASLTGKQVTFSVYVANVTGAWRLGGLSLGNLLTNLSAGINYVTATVTNNTNTEFNISTAQSGASIDVIAAKLELGSYSTLAQDIMPDYGEELTRCIYSTADPTDTYANNGFGRTNPNLLDNWWFGNPVNQRGQTTYNGSGSFLKTIDRWLLANGSGENNLDVRSGYVAVKSDGDGFIQRIEPSLGTALNGKVLTWSVLLNDGTLKTATGKYDNTTTVSLGNGFYCGLIGGSQTIVSYTTGIGITQWIKAMKVELGTVSTLANDTPPDYGTELAKCQRYFVRVLGDPFGTGYITTAGNNSRITVPVPMTMRATPTVSFSGTFHLRVQGNTLNVTTMSAVSPKNTAGGITLSCSGFSGATTGCCALYADGLNCYIDFSADL